MLLAVFCLVFVLSACSAETSNQQSGTSASGNGADVEVKNETKTDEQQAEEPKNEEPAAGEPKKIGETMAIGDWEVTLNAVEFVESVTEGMLVFGPDDEGQKMAVVELTVKNNGTGMETFLPVMKISDQDISVKLLYDGKFEYSFTHYLGLSGQLHMESLNPLASKTGTIIFDVVEEVESSGKPLHLIFEYDNKEYTFDLR